MRKWILRLFRRRVKKVPVPLKWSAATCHCFLAFGEAGRHKCGIRDEGIGNGQTVSVMRWLAKRSRKAIEDSQQTKEGSDS